MSLVSLTHTSLSAILERKSLALLWGLPEQWVHAELFAELSARSSNSGWIPIPEEVPYLTYLPVSLPAKRDWKNLGAMKWIDLCLHSADRRNWAWLELKVRHAGVEERRSKAERDALHAMKKDVVALMGFDREETARAWEVPDEDTKIHWAERLLKPYAKAIRNGQHSFMTLYLQLNDAPNLDIWNQDAIAHAIKSWFQHRDGESSVVNKFPKTAIHEFEIETNELHSLTSVTWTLEGNNARIH